MRSSLALTTTTMIAVLLAGVAQAAPRPMPGPTRISSPHPQTSQAATATTIVGALVTPAITTEATAMAITGPSKPPPEPTSSPTFGSAAALPVSTNRPKTPSGTQESYGPPAPAPAPLPVAGGIFRFMF